MAADTQPKPSPSEWRAWVGWLGTFAWSMGVFAAEVSTAPHFTFEPFYVPAVVYAGWRSGRAGVVLVGAISAILGVIAERAQSESLLGLMTNVEHPAAPYWNGAAHLTMYLVVGLSICALRSSIRQRDTLLNDLQEAANRIRTLQGLLPMCAWCKQIRDDELPDRWLPLERYITEHTNAQITHGICPSCASAVLSSEEGVAAP